MRQGDSDLIAFGQLGSTFSKTAGETVKPPSGRHIIAITFLADSKLSALTAVNVKNSSSSFNHADEGAAAAADNGEPITTSTIFPKGLTIYGKWTEASLTIDDADGGMICYFG